jgi:ABC-2 type transport system permease protein
MNIGFDIHVILPLVALLTAAVLGLRVQLPAVWTLIGLAAALFGLMPKQSGVAWGALGLFVFLGQVGAILGLPQWVLDLSPFTHTPRLPGASFDPLPLIFLTGITAALLVAGQIGFRRRDMSRA